VEEYDTGCKVHVVQLSLTGSMMTAKSDLGIAGIEYFIHTLGQCVQIVTAQYNKRQLLALIEKTVAHFYQSSSVKYKLHDIPEILEFLATQTRYNSH
jgi:hypothetical protein